jgi:hypothetical protein
MPSILLLVTGYASHALPMISSTEMEISYSHALGSWNKQTLNLYDIDTKQQIDQTKDCINKMALFS